MLSAANSKIWLQTAQHSSPYQSDRASSRFAVFAQIFEFSPQNHDLEQALKGVAELNGGSLKILDYLSTKSHF
jgi:hypothetical protein